MDHLKIHILDILSILMPGAILMAILAQFSNLESSFTQLFSNNIELITIVTYVGVAYTLGHFIYFVGSFLDDILYDRIKFFIWKDQTLPSIIVALKERKTGIKDVKVLNAFKWSCAWLQANKPDMYATVERHVAESKFFRSLVVVLVIALVTFIIKDNLTLVVASLVLIVLSVIRYLTQRYKSVVTAYHFVITCSGEVFKIEKQ